MIRTRICECCGKEFQTTHPTKKYCGSSHIIPCSVCGKLFEISNTKLATGTHTCSPECANKAKAIHYSEPKVYDCVCKACGAHFTSTHPNAQVCDGVHMVTCAVCGKEFSATKQQIISGTKTCSDECRYKLVQSTCMDRYGVSNAMQSEQFSDKMHDTMVKRYGAAHTMQIEEFKHKAEQTFLSKYGYTNPNLSPEVQAKREQTFLAKYGVKQYIQTEEFKTKSRETCIQKYGVPNAGGAYQIGAFHISDPDKAENWQKFHDDPETFIKSHFGDEPPEYSEVAKLCGINKYTVTDILGKQNKLYLVKMVYSSMESEVFDFVSELLKDDLDVNTEIQRNTKKIITPKELDLYIPKYKFAIECNPTNTHNSSIGGFSNATDAVKPKNYHQLKSKACEELGIFLFHIFGYDWGDKQDIIKSMIKNALGKTDNKIYARNTEIRSVSGADAYKFLTENHRQGGLHSKVRLGLYHNNELVSLMTFGHMRNTIGIGKEDLSDCWELARFCNKLNTSVVGGASKLFKHFVKTYNPARIRSFSDIAHTKGTLYESLGFKYLHSSEPNYMWVDYYTNKAYSRVNAQKRNVQRFLKDFSINLDDPEAKIMVEHGFVQVFDSGTKLWEWTSTTLSN